MKDTFYDSSSGVKTSDPALPDLLEQKPELPAIVLDQAELRFAKQMESM